MSKYKIVTTNEVDEFILQCKKATQKKIFFTFDKIKLGIFGQIYSKMPGTKGMYECRIKSKDHWIRFLAKHWKDNDGTLIIVLIGFYKKSNKIPKTEIDRAEEVYKKLFLKDN